MKHSQKFREVKKMTKEARNRTIVVFITIALGILLFIGMQSLMPDEEFTPHNEDLVLVKDISSGKAIPTWSQKDENICQQETMFDYPYGWGLSATMRVVFQGKTVWEEAKTFIPAWQEFQEEGDNNLRNEIARKGCADFKKALANFKAMKDPIGHGIVIDTTEEITDELTSRALGIFETICGVDCEVMEIRDTQFIKAVKPGSKENFKLWLRGHKVSSQTSILKGLMQIMTYVTNNHPGYRVHVFTDGLENSPKTISAYSNPGILQEQNWGKMDKYFKIQNLDLSGIEIHIHPLRVSNAKLQEKAHIYLQRRLKESGARVTIKPFVAFTE